MKRIIYALIVMLLLVQVKGRDCYLACDEVQITYDKQLCYDNCDIRVIVGAAVGSFIGLCLLICFICFCRYRRQACMYFLKKKLKKRYNQVDPGTCSLAKFQHERNDFINALMKSEFTNNFYFQVNKKKFTMRIEGDSFNMVQEDDFLSRIEFKGKDDYSTFHAEGYFLCKDGFPSVWFYKRYEPYDLAVQYGLKEIIIFESLKGIPKAWMGNWAAEEQQAAENINGRWFLIMRVVGISNRLEEINSQSDLV